LSVRDRITFVEIKNSDDNSTMKYYWDVESAFVFTRLISKGHYSFCQNNSWEYNPINI